MHMHRQLEGLQREKQFLQLHLPLSCGLSAVVLQMGLNMYPLGFLFANHLNPYGQNPYPKMIAIRLDLNSSLEAPFVTPLVIPIFTPVAR
jgi:hypothetical protein